MCQALFSDTAACTVSGIEYDSRYAPGVLHIGLTLPDHYLKFAISLFCHFVSYYHFNKFGL